MAEPTIVPPTPVITQPSHPGEIDTSPGLDQLQAVFDRVLPEIKTQPTPKSTTAPPETQPRQPGDTPPPPVQPIEEPPKEPAREPSQPEEEPARPQQREVPPSILEQALRGEGSQPSPAPAEEEWPEELPAFKNSDEAKARYKAWRASYGKVKGELKSLQEKPSLDARQLQRMEYLETQNKQMGEALSRYGVQNSAEFQQRVMQPLYQSWNEAARIVRQAGGDPQELAKAMTLQGKAQFEALDTIFGEMPESAKMEAHEALRNYRRFEEARQQTLRNAPAAMEGIRQRETERQYAEVSKQREGMKNIFERAYDRLKNEAKLEVYQTTDLPEAKWWNEQGEQLVKQSRDLYLENTDMDRVAFACLLAPAADVYRKLWFNAQNKVGELQKIINERIGSEPNLSENGGPGNVIPPERQLEEDLKKPFNEVFLREFHRAQAQRR